MEFPIKKKNGKHGILNFFLFSLHLSWPTSYAIALASNYIHFASPCSKFLTFEILFSVHMTYHFKFGY